MLIDTNKGLVHLELQHVDGKLRIQPLFSTTNVPQWTVSRLMNTLVDTIRTCVKSPHMNVEDSIKPIARDLDDLWGWNHSLPPLREFCMHDYISERAQSTAHRKQTRRPFDHPTAHASRCRPLSLPPWHKHRLSLRHRALAHRQQIPRRRRRVVRESRSGRLGRSRRRGCHERPLRESLA